MVTFKRVNPLTGRTPHKKQSKKETYILTAPRAAFTPERIKELEREFKAAGVNVILLLYNNNSPAKPQLDKI